MKKLIIATILVLVSVQSWADLTGSSGSFNHGGDVTLTGSGFGTHPNNNEGSFTWQGASPVCAKFKDFEDGSLTSGGWSMVVNNLYDDWSIAAGGRDNSTYYAYRECNNGDLRYDALQYTMSHYNASGQVYVRFYIQASEVTASGGGKVWRIYGDAGNIYVGIDNDDRDVEGMSTMWGGAGQLTSVSQYSLGSWDLMEIFLSDENEVTCWLNGIQQWTRDDWVTSPLGGDGHSFDIGHMIEPGGDYYLYDDIYVDYTMDRFELCNSSTYASATIREVQIPTSWTDSSVNIAVNTGAFASGQTAWLYFIDSTNTPGAGLEITIGEASTNPVVNAGTDQTVYVSSATMSGLYTLSDGRTVVSCTWVNDQGGSGSLTASGGVISGTVTGLSEGANIITITVTDSSTESGNDSLTITYTPPAGGASSATVSGVVASGCIIR